MTAMPHLFKRLVSTSAVALAMLASAANTTLAQSANENNTQVQPEGTVRVYKLRLKHDVPLTTKKGPAPESAPAGAHLTYYGGRVVGSAQIVQVLWGTGSYLSQVSGTGTPSMASFYEQLLSSTYTDWLDSEYNTVVSGGTNQHISNGGFQLQVTITPSVTSTTVSDAQIQTELTNQITAGHLPAPATDAGGNPITIYTVFFPPGMTITQGGSSSCVAGGFCGYHGTVAASGSIDEFFYGVHPDMQAGSGCDTGCGASTTFGNYTSVASHELVETITDAEVGLATVTGPPLAWYDATNGEIGDICNGQQGNFVGNDGESYVLQYEFSNAQSNCIIPDISYVFKDDFAINSSPSSLSLAQGSSGASTISTAVVSGSATTISLALSGIPAGATSSLSPGSITAGGSATLTVHAGTAAPGNYTVFITGTQGTKTHTTTVMLTVTATANDFSMSASPSGLKINFAGSGASAISTAVTSGNAATVNLSASVSPAGPTASLSPTSVTAGAGSTLTVNAGSATPGNYTITVTGTEGTSTHYTNVSVSVHPETTTTNLASSHNPSYLHQTVTFTASITSQNGGAVTGTMTFKQNGTVLCTVPVASGQAACSTNYPTTGTHSITAIYSGDSNNLGSKSAVLTQRVPGTQTVVVTSGSPSFVGQLVTFTSTTTWGGMLVPDGEPVNFYDGLTLIGGGGTTNGAVTISTSDLKAGLHSIQASYFGDDDKYQASGAKLSQTINKYATTTSLSSSPNPSTHGQAVTFSAQVVSTGPITPTGTVTFRNGTTVLGSVSVDGTGTATLTKTGLPAGSDLITATYKGDASDLGSTSSALTQTVN